MKLLRTKLLTGIQFVVLNVTSLKIDTVQHRKRQNINNETTMKSLIKTLTISLAVWALVGAGFSANALTVGVDPAPGYSGWIGYMNVFNITGLPGYGAAAASGGTVGGTGPWGTVDLVATWSGPTLTLAPNTIGDPNSYWYTPTGQPGSVGNKIMDANMYVEIGSLPGQTLTFEGRVLANTLANGPVNQLGEGWTSVAFIKDFAPDYSSFNIQTAPLTPGYFSFSLATVNDPARHVQYGFETIGPDVWFTDVGQYGSIQVIPEPSTLALLGLGMVGALVWRRRQ
jgi:hypothetical protein